MALLHPNLLNIVNWPWIGMTDKNPTLQCLGSIITTSVSLPHDLADRRIGTGFMPTTSTLRRFFHMGRWAAMTLPASACEEVGRVSWALKKDYYYTTEMQSWYAKMAVCVCVLAGVDYWTHIYAIKLWWHHNQYLAILFCKRRFSEQAVRSCVCVFICDVWPWEVKCECNSLMLFPNTLYVYHAIGHNGQK